jgi:hypothetical protein
LAFISFSFFETWHNRQLGEALHNKKETQTAPRADFSAKKA